MTDPQRTLAKLIDRWPDCFSAGRPRPLKVGIATDITSSPGVGEVGTTEEICAALGQYVATEAYLKVMTKGAARINLSGVAVGKASAYEAERAEKMLQGRRAERAAR
jgi:sRNA-binding protein